MLQHLLGLFDVVKQGGLVLGDVVGAEGQPGVQGLVVLDAFDEFLNEGEAFFYFESLGCLQLLQVHIVGLSRHKGQADITEVEPVHANVGDAAQLSVEHQHAGGNLGLLGDLEPFGLPLEMRLLLGGEDSQMSGAYIQQDHLDLSLVPQLQRHVVLFLPEAFDQLHRVHHLQVETAQPGNMVDALILPYPPQKNWNTFLHILEGHSGLPFLNTQHLTQQIAAVIDAGQGQIVQNVQPGCYGGVTLAQHQTELDAVGVSGELVGLAAAGDLEPEQGELGVAAELGAIDELSYLGGDQSDDLGLLVAFAELGLVVGCSDHGPIGEWAIIIMEVLKNALQDLLTSPKQATATINMLVNTDPDFIKNLTTIILDSCRCESDPTLLKISVVTLNSVALQFSTQKDIKKCLVMEQIYASLKRVLSEPGISFETKRLLQLSLEQYLMGAFSTHKQILELKAEILQYPNKQAVLVILQSITLSTAVPRPIQIECIVELFDMAVEELYRLVEIVKVGTQYQQMHQCSQTVRVIDQIMYCIELQHSIFLKVFRQLLQPYEYDAFVYMSSDRRLFVALMELLQWANPLNQQYRYPWTEDWTVRVDGRLETITQLYRINNIKEKIFIILASVLSKTQPSYNLYHCQHPLMSRLPALCTEVLTDLFHLRPHFGIVDEELCIGSLCDAMLCLLSECIRFADLLHVFADQVPRQDLILLTTSFLKLREADEGSLTLDYFADFIEGFSGGNNLQQVSRYGVSKFLQQCCIKLDQFPSQLFQACYNGLILQICRRLRQKNLAETQDCYQHLFIETGYQKVDTSGDITSCLLGILAMHNQISIRSDFRDHLADFLIVLDMSHLQYEEIAILYLMLSDNLKMFSSASLLQACHRLLDNILALPKQEQICFSVMIEFMRVLYLRHIVCVKLDSPVSQELIGLACRSIWATLLKLCEADRLEVYDSVCDFVNVRALCRRDEPQLQQVTGKSYRGAKEARQNILGQPQTIGEYLVQQKSQFIMSILTIACAKLTQALLTDSHSQQLTIRLHQVIVQCLNSLHFIVCLGNARIKAVEFVDYLQPVLRVVESVMDPSDHTDPGQHLSAEEAIDLVDLLALLISQQRAAGCRRSHIPSRMFECLFPVMIRYPFGQAWLTCICEFVFRIEGKFELNQIETISQMVHEGLSRFAADELKLNQLCLFSIVLLNFHLPENWQRIHEQVRVLLVKLIKIQAQPDKLQRHRKMIEYGFLSDSIFGITVIRLFHVYLYGFKLEPIHDLLSQLLEPYAQFVEKYCLVEATHLIIGLKSSFKTLSRDNFDTILDTLLLILNKLVINHNYYGSQSLQQARIRKLSHKIGCFALDPFVEFKSLLEALRAEGYDLAHHPKHEHSVKQLLNVSTCMGQPRRIYSIAKPKK